MTPQEFEQLLDQVAARLTSEAMQEPFSTSKVFENRVREILEELGRSHGVEIDHNPHPYAFPDIEVGEYGVEVKFTTSDSWRSVANSVFETFRNRDITDICVMYGKMGGTPGVRWARYADCVIHVRTSHVPRFELDIDATFSLFAKMGITYDEFSVLPMEGKMRHIREYARGRLKRGERLWWLEDRPESDHSLPIEARLYTTLDDEEQRRLRAEATLLCPQIFKSRGARDKYNDLALYLLTYHGVLAHQVRDLFTAGSVSQHVELPANLPQATVNIARSTFDIQDEIRAAALRMDDALFVEYWGESVAPMFRIGRWLELADQYAVGWVPSQVLFK